MTRTLTLGLRTLLAVELFYLAFTLDRTTARVLAQGVR